jgi:uncharacterized membrane protein YfcA
MEFDARLFALAGIVLFAFTTEAATGFGSTVIALALGVRLYPIHGLLPTLVPLNLLLSSYIVSRHHAHIALSVVRSRILPCMGVGVAAGLALFEHLSSETLRMIFGIFVVGVAVRELVAAARPARAQPRALSATTEISGLLAAGVVHGMFATGGPLLVYVLARSGLGKHSFRSTLAAVWWIFNVALILVYIATGRMDATVLPVLAALAPAVVLSIVGGEWVHHRLNEQRFRLAVLVLLIVAGVSIVL